MGFVRAIMTSSSYKPILCSVSPIVISKTEGAERIVCVSGSISIVKISGESGHPCLVPFVIIKRSDTIPKVQTHTLGEEYTLNIKILTRDQIFKEQLPFRPSGSFQMPSLRPERGTEKACDGVTPIV